MSNYLSLWYTYFELKILISGSFSCMVGSSAVSKVKHPGTSSGIPKEVRVKIIYRKQRMRPGWKAKSQIVRKQ